MSQSGNAPAKKATTATAIAPKNPTFKVEDLAELTSFDDAIAFLQDKGIEVVSSAEVLNDGFEGIEKADLVNIPFVIVRITRTMSKEFNTPMVVIHAITATHKRVRFTDGSTGIMSQLAYFQEKSGRSAVGLVVPKGLLASNYVRKERDKEGNLVLDDDGNPIDLMENGKPVSATTFYLSTEK